MYLRENNTRLGKTFVYTYDNAGNITSKRTYSYTTGSTDNLTPVSTNSYTYGNSAWSSKEKRLIILSRKRNRPKQGAKKDYNSNQDIGFAIGIGPTLGADLHVNETDTITIGDAFPSLIKIIMAWFGF